MKKLFRNVGAAALMALCALPAMAQLSSDGFYRFRNAQYTSDYISIANDLFNYTTCISTAGGGLGQFALWDPSGARARALECAGKYLATDIHMIEDAECIYPADVIYAFKASTNPYDNGYNLIGQGTSLLTLTTGTYPGSTYVEFSELYINIVKESGSGENSLYSASIELKSSNYSAANLGVRYFVDDNGTFAINTSKTATNAKWYVEPVAHFNVKPEVEYLGKYYTTIKVPFDFQLSENVLNAYSIAGISDDGVLAYEVVASTGGTVPAGMPVVLECSSPNAADCQLIPLTVPRFTDPDLNATSNAPRADNGPTFSDNMLAGTYYCNTDGTITFTTKSGTDTFNANNRELSTGKYVIGITESGKLGFVPAAPLMDVMPANKAWLTIAGEFPWEAAPVHSTGDVNHDGKTSIKDVTALVNYLLSKTGEICTICADVNGDEDITIKDVTMLINLILTNGGSEE